MEEGVVTTLIRFIVIRYVQCFLGNSYIIMYMSPQCTVICTLYMHTVYALVYAHCICTLYMHWYMHIYCICTLYITVGYLKPHSV